MKVNSKSYLIILLLTVLVFIGCATTPSDIGSFKAWFSDPENGFVKQKQIGMLKFTVQRRPVELMMTNEIENGATYDQNFVDDLRKSYGDNLHFMLEVSLAEAQDEGVPLPALKTRSLEEYQSLVSEMSFSNKNNVRLISDSDTLSPILSHYERGYELGQRQRFLFAFSNVQDEGEHIKFSFYDTWFGTGKHYFKFDRDLSYPDLPITIQL